MELPQLKQELLNGKLRPYYIFIGDELALQDVYINKIYTKTNNDLIKLNSLIIKWLLTII